MSQRADARDPGPRRGSRYRSIARSRSALVLLVSGALGLPCAALGAVVNRCEGPDRRVTYSNEGCPPGTRLVRSFEATQPVVVHGGDARPAASDTTPEGNRQPEEPGDRKASSGRVQRGTPRPAETSPEGARASVAEQRQARIAACDGLVRKIEFAQRDLASSSPADRASNELALRRLQQEREERCAPAKP